MYVVAYYIVFAIINECTMSQKIIYTVLLLSLKCMMQLIMRGQSHLTGHMVSLTCIDIKMNIVYI